jgi:HEAT repeat protein
MQEAVGVLAELAGDGSAAARVRLLHTAVCAPKLPLRQAATRALGVRGETPGLESFPVVRMADAEDRRLLRATWLRLLQHAFRRKQRWPVALLRERIVVEPMLAMVARQVVWGSYAGGAFAGAFVLDEAATPMDAELEAIAWPGDEVGIPWAVELGDQVEVWQRYFEDHDLVDQLAQLHTLPKEGAELRELVENRENMRAVSLGRRMRPGDVWSALHDLVDDEDPERRHDALDVCKGVRLRAAIPAFEAGLTDPSGNVSRVAAEAVRAMGLDELMPIVAIRLLDGNWDMLPCFTSWAGKRGTAVIRRWLAHPSWEVRAAAARAAAWKGSDKPMKTALIAMASGDPDPRVRLEAVVAGGERIAKIDRAAVAAAVAAFPEDARLTLAAERIEAAHTRGY